MKGEVYAQHKLFNRRSALVHHAVQTASGTHFQAQNAKEHINHADTLGRLRHNGSGCGTPTETPIRNDTTDQQKGDESRTRRTPIHQKTNAPQIQILDHRNGNRKSETTISEILPHLQSTGKAAAYATAIIALISLCPRGAGAYTSGSADYGQVIAQLQQLNSNNVPGTEMQNTYETLLPSLWGTVPISGGAPSLSNMNASNNGNLASGFDYPYLNIIAAELGPHAYEQDQVPSYLGYALNTSNGPSGMTYALGNQQWNVHGNAAYAQSNFATKQAGTAVGIWSTQMDHNGYSVFESPNGNSYLDWSPVQAQSLQTGTTTGSTIQWQNAVLNTNPYGIFKDKYGGSVFQDPQGLSYFTGIKYDDTNSPYITTGTTTNANRRQGSVFTDAFGNGVFTYTSYNPLNGTIGVTNSQNEPTQSVFIAGTGNHESDGNPGPTGSVFVTDDSTNGNVGNSVFLDPYGNSYLDDITNALTLPGQMVTNAYQQPGTIQQPEWNYSTTGQLTFWQPTFRGGTNSTNDTQPLTITELIALAFGESPTTNSGTSTNGTTYYSFSYPWLSAMTMLEPSGWSDTQYWNGLPGLNGSYKNMFAEAFYNPMATGTTTLVPYLSALSGYDPNSPAEQTRQTTADNDYASMMTTINSGVTNHEQYASPYQGQFTPQGWTGQTVTANGTTWTMGADITQAGINPGYFLQTVATGAGFSSGTPATETEAATAAYTLYADFAQAGPLPPGYTGSINTTVLPGSSIPSYAAVPLTIIDAVMTDAEWWQTNMTWFIDFFSAMWIVYCCVSTLRWVNWGLHGGEFPLRVIMRATPANSDDHPVNKPVPNDLTAPAGA